MMAAAGLPAVRLLNKKTCPERLTTEQALFQRLYKAMSRASRGPCNGRFPMQKMIAYNRVPVNANSVLRVLIGVTARQSG